LRHCRRPAAGVPPSLPLSCPKRLHLLQPIFETTNFVAKMSKLVCRIRLCNNFETKNAFRCRVVINFVTGQFANAMKHRLFIAAVMLLSTTSLLHAQELNGAKTMVVFDPLFWKDQLKLDDSQCLRIREINSLFYKKLSDVANEANHQVVRAKAAQSLLERSEEIWETFHPKQRRKWKKIAQETVI